MKIAICSNIVNNAPSSMQTVLCAGPHPSWKDMSLRSVDLHLPRLNDGAVGKRWLCLVYCFRKYCICSSKYNYYLGTLLICSFLLHTPNIQLREAVNEKSKFINNFIQNGQIWNLDNVNIISGHLYSIFRETFWVWNGHISMVYLFVFFPSWPMTLI